MNFIRKENNMKFNYLLVFENKNSVRRFHKSTNIFLKDDYESVTWLEENDARVRNLIELGYWVKTIIML